MINKNESEKVSSYPFNDLLVKGCVFSIYSDMGPEAILCYPLPKDTSFSLLDLSSHISSFSQRNYMQVAVKSISLLLTDYSFEDKSNNYLENIHIFGVLPYPDMKCVGLTYFCYYFSSKSDQYIPATITLFVHEDHRNFIYDAFDRLKQDIQNFTSSLIKVCQDHHISSELGAQDFWVENLPRFINFFQKIEKIQSKPISPITQKRRIKILFTGLENTGKTSFLLTIKREFSALPSLLPTTEPTKDSLDFLGTTIMKWDIPGQKVLRDAILKNAERYLYDSDVIYYFIDIQDPQIADSKIFLSQIVSSLSLSGIKVPIIFILTKCDEDIIHSSKIANQIQHVKTIFSNIVKDVPHKYFETSIFSDYSILNAFSYGIRQLSPNKEMLEHLMWEFIGRLGMITGLLLNENGIVIASADISDGDTTNKFPHSRIFEIAAPQFTTIARQFTQYNPHKRNDLIKYQFSNDDIVLLKKFKILDFMFFSLFYTKKLESVDQLEQNFPVFIEKIKNLIEMYIS
ncbi:hypothetical protein NEF87_004665 [Candidatus Lokiarchaeum ossiferum]|uniref:Uncharacterized protein n=1 Tax=Candidatus Lokiarchaeum ossiferum TaxID=2951803 RepID=A0ABY6HY75_9ARCH|nr:hypothetical protein NEF87_004665 [Candidatus Lokiarchaeum sp. B-35]